ncbi:signal-regulatory protein beta-1-like protein [Pitangus sulphuratus]|nr:signal-regulatory protein beta-1-like protein [Pitangus sulphuratus]
MAAAAAPLLSGQLSGAGAQGSQDFKLHQPQDKVSVTVGKTLTLNCIVSGSSEPGPVKWLKGWGTENRTIYGDTGSAAPRVMRAMKDSDTDFTIHIRDAQPEDAGTYYCVKFRKSTKGGNEVFRRGSGTEVSVLEAAVVPGMVAAVVVLCVLLLLVLLVALCLYRRKRQGTLQGARVGIEWAAAACLWSQGSLHHICTTGPPLQPYHRQPGLNLVLGVAPCKARSRTR